MSKILLYLLAITITMLFGLCACESGGNFVVYNRTGFPLMTSVDDGDTLTIASGANLSFKIDTDTQSLLTGEVSRKVKVKIFGETYSLEDTDTNEYMDSTYVRIKAGKTLGAYIDPNRASVKVENNMDENIALVEIFKCKNIDQTRVSSMTDIPPLGSKWNRVDYATMDNPFYYKVVVTMDSGLVYTYGGPQTILAKDEQFLVDVHLDEK